MKNNITIVCDSSVDLTAEFMRERNIEFLSLLVDLNGHVYKDKVDLSNKEFYEAIKHKETTVKTSQVTPYEFQEFFKKELECGNKVICLTCSSKLSGTNSSANIAKMHLEEGSENIFVVDTLVASGGFGYLVTVVADMRDKGYTVDKILDEINDLVGRLETLIVDIMNTRELDPQYDIVVSHANDLEAANQTVKLIEADLGINKIFINEIGTAVGTHSGAGAIAIFYIKKK